MPCFHLRHFPVLCEWLGWIFSVELIGVFPGTSKNMMFLNTIFSITAAVLGLFFKSTGKVIVSDVASWVYIGFLPAAAAPACCGYGR